MKNTLIFLSMILALSAVSAFGQHASVMGNWTTYVAKSTSYTSQTTNAPVPLEPFVSYKFQADGTYEYYLNRISTAGNCTVSSTSFHKGTYALDGTTLTLTPGKNKESNKNTCTSNSLYGDRIETTKAGPKRIYEVRNRKADGDQESLCLKANGGETCYYRAP